ncbi:thioredoxin family protein [Mumia sp. Pv 4-285]|uniref:thioredoxin family protein n=1 Tax=Mumia qirimensis TaxID=3234852 RepID=UPI00351DA67F
MPLGVSVLLVVLVMTGAFAAVHKHRDGRVRAMPAPVGEVDTDAPRAPRAARHVLSVDDIGAALGSGATLVQVSSAFCAPCRSARVLLTQVAGRREDVAYVDVDAESHLDLVRRLNVMRTPTIMVLDRDGVVVGRASGVPRMSEIEAVLDSVTASSISDGG